MGDDPGASYPGSSEPTSCVGSEVWKITSYALRAVDRVDAGRRLLGEVSGLAGEVLEPSPRGLDLLEPALLLRAVALELVEREERGAEDDDEERADQQQLDEA